MALSQLADIFVVSPFTDRMEEVARNINGIRNSGAVVSSNQLQENIGSGFTVDVPFFRDTTISSGSGTVSTDDSTLIVPSKIEGNNQRAVKISRNEAWSSASLLKSALGEDILGYAASKLAAYEVKLEDIVIKAALKGVIADSVANSSSDLIEDNTGVSISRDMIVSSLYNSMTDAVSDIAVIVMSPAIIASLKSEDLDNWTAQGAADGASILFERYLGIRVIVDSKMPVAALNYTTYMLSNGAIAYAKANLGNDAVRVDKDNLAGSGRGVEFLSFSTDFVAHILGFQWTGASMAGSTPTDVELENEANYLRVFSDRRNIGVMSLVSLA